MYLLLSSISRAISRAASFTLFLHNKCFVFLLFNSLKSNLILKMPTSQTSLCGVGPARTSSPHCMVSRGAFPYLLTPLADCCYLVHTTPLLSVTPGKSSFPSGPPVTGGIPQRAFFSFFSPLSAYAHLFLLTAPHSHRSDFPFFFSFFFFKPIPFFSLPSP